MASINGSFNGAWPAYATPYIEYSYSQDIANNQTTVTAYFRVLRNSSKTTAWDSTSSAYLEINGDRKNLDFSFDIRPIGVGSSMTIMSHSVTVPHNADGTKSINLSAAVYTDTSSLNDGTVSGSVTLPTIPRASSISCPTLTMGTAGTITISRASSSFTHTITASFGSTSATITTKTTGTSVSWTPLLAWAAQIPNATSGTCTLTCITYSGSTEVGRKSISITLNVPASVKPTLTSLTAARVDGSVPAAWGVYVKDKSKVKLTINGAAGAQGSSIRGYSISGGGYSSGSSSYTTGFLNAAGTITFTATVTDSRGRTSDPKTVSITVVDYAAPTLTIQSAARYADRDCTTQDDTGGYCKILWDFAIAPCSNKNARQYRVRYRQTGETVGPWATFLDYGDAMYAYTGSVSTYQLAVSTETSYEIEISIRDSFATISQTISLTSAATTMDFKRGGKGVAVGKVAELDNAFDSAWPIYEQGKRVATNVLHTLGIQAPQTGRTQAYTGAYTYNVNASADTAAPSDFISVLGFGRGGSGSVEIAANWTGGCGVWVRALRDFQDDWFAWQRVYTTAYKPTCADIGAIKGVLANSYYGLAWPDGNVGNWIRTTENGLLPYATGGASAIGTPDWPFANGYFVNLNCTGASRAAGGFTVDETCHMLPQRHNEVNFQAGGAGGNIWFGYRKVGSYSVAEYDFGNTNGGYGNICAQVGTFYGGTSTGSTITSKTNVETLAEAEIDPLHIVRQTPVYRYKYLADIDSEFHNYWRPQIGFISELSPGEITTMEKDGIEISNALGIAYGAIQQVADQTDRNTAEIAAIWEYLEEVTKNGTAN